MPLVEVVQKLSFARDLASVQQIVRHAARNLTGADGATFVLRDKGECFYADEDAIAPLWKGMRFPLNTCVSGWSMLHHAAAVIPDVYADARIPAGVYRKTFVKSLAIVPIRKADPLGAIGNYWATYHEATREEVRILQALADTTALALENVRIYRELEQRVRERTRELEEACAAVRSLSLLDDLTGLCNRRGFLLLAEQSRKAAQRAGMDLFIAYVDADGLKQINDTQGHQAGDNLLKGLAAVLQHTFRGVDVIGRLGGDEFCVLGTAQGDIHAITRRLSGAIGTYNDAAAHGAPRLGASCGIAIWAADSEASLGDIVKQADEAMYAAKRAAQRAQPVPVPML